MSSPVPVELLAPAGDGDCLRAAVANGADAVYLGLDEGFNARARAANFSLASLPEALRFAHDYGVKVYATLNTLAFVDELARLELVVRALADLGVDALLVQDFGLARLAKRIAPGLPLHASTQMSLTSSQGIRIAQTLGIERVVLARELSIDEMGQIEAPAPISLEAFVHGALCVAYSGQCLTSESLGGRSANRGECAQACRLGYQLVCDDRDVDLGEQRYLLSPQDLAAYAHIPQLIAAGVRSFKIEGRLKTPEYVANVTRRYRQAIDDALAGVDSALDPCAVEEMAMSFSRGFSPGWLEGCDHKRLVPALSSAKRGLRLGRVVGTTRKGVCVALERPIQRGDGVAFAGDAERRGEQGGRVYETIQGGISLTGPVAEGEVELAFARDAIQLERLTKGQEVWKTDDPELNRRLRATFARDGLPRRVPLALQVVAEVGSPLVVTGRTATGIGVAYRGAAPLAAARTRPADEAQIAQHLGRLGRTRYALGDLVIELAGAPMIPLSVLGDARRAIVAQLAAGTPSRPHYAIDPPGTLERLRSAIGAFAGDARAAETRSIAAQSDATTSRTAFTLQGRPRLWALCRSLDQLTLANQGGADGLYVDFADIRQYGEATRIVQRLNKPLFLAPPRIQKPGEYGLFAALARHGADGLLARNLGAVAFCRERNIRWIADFSLNAANDLAVDWLSELGAERATASYDLNRDQLGDLAHCTAPGRLEVVVHQHMPMFHMEHCVFCAVLSPGSNKHDCGRPCDRHQVRLRDRVGMEHPLTADVGCRNTLYNAAPQSGAEAIGELAAAGVGDFRVELLESTTDPQRVVRLYRDLLDGRTNAPSVWRVLRAVNRVGVTRGTLEERRNPLAIL